MAPTAGSRIAPSWRVGADPARRPLLIFDGECGFCRRGVDRWRARTGNAVEYVPSSEAAGRFPGIPGLAFGESAILVEPDGAAFRGAAAILLLRARTGRGRLWLWMYERLPGSAAVAELLYRLVARHRSLLSRLRFPHESER